MIPKVLRTDTGVRMCRSYGPPDISVVFTGPDYFLSALRVGRGRHALNSGEFSYLLRHGMILR